jgi:hypothetical protein
MTRHIGALIVVWGFIVLLLLGVPFALPGTGNGGPPATVPKMTPYPDPSRGGPSTLRP